MKREDAKKLWPIMKAYAEGKNIEFRSHHDHNGLWEVMLDPAFNGDVSNYRIAKEPKYRPFKTVKECWDEMVKHTPFGWLSSIKTGNIAAIGSVNDKDGQIYIKWATNECFSFTAEDVGSDYVFADGAPFGIKED